MNSSFNKPLSENSNRVKAKAIIKEWSQQHEYELGKYAIELLRQSKASRNEISQTIQFIVDQANSASEWTQEKVTLEHKITELEATIKVLRETKLKLTEEKDTASAEIERLKAELEVKKSEIVAKDRLNYFDRFSPGLNFSCSIVSLRV